MRSHLFILTMMTLTGCVPVAQRQGAPAPVVTATRSNPPATPQRRSDGFTQSYVGGIRAETDLIRAAGLGAKWDALRPIVAAHFPPQINPPPVSAADVPVIFQARIDGTTNFLIKTGYRVRHLASEQQARSIVGSAVITAWEDAGALVRIAPMVVVAALDRVERNADGSEDLVYRVTERIKSGPPLGTELRFQLHAAPPASAQVGVPPPPPPPNPPLEEMRGYKSAVLFLQPAETVIVPAGRPRPQRPATLFGPVPVSGDKVLPSYHSSMTPTTLAALRAAAKAQRCSPGYVPVAPDGTAKC